MAKNNELFSIICGIIFIIIFAIILDSCVISTSSKLINDKVHSINGEVIEINQKTLLDDTPFIIYKNERAYEFTYTINSKIKTGWYKNGIFDEWILDYQSE